jgi:hypothetical protein
MTIGQFGLFTSPTRLTKKYLAADLAGGSAIYFHRFKLTWVQVPRTREFDGQPDDHGFGSLSLSFFL